MSVRTVGGFALALVVQVALLAMLPWERESDEATSRTIWLAAKAAGGRQDLLQGPYVHLTYDISNPAQFADFPALAAGSRARRSGETIYVVVTETQPGLWSGLRVVQGEIPSGLPESQVAIRGEVVDRGLQINAYLRQETDGSWVADSIVTGEMLRTFDHRQQDRALAGARVGHKAIVYRDIESYFVPQSDRRRFEEDLRAHPGEARAQVRVREDGGASLLQVRVQDRTYDF